MSPALARKGVLLGKVATPLILYGRLV